MTNTVHFTKMHGLGNDFMVVNAMENDLHLTSKLIRRWSNRRRGVGFDQLLLVEKAKTSQADFHYRIFNADGGEVEQCGNGARCFARYVVEKGLTDKTTLRVTTKASELTLTLKEQGQVLVDMGPPIFTPAQIPFSMDSQAKTYTLALPLGPKDVGVVSMGNPHCVLWVDDVEDYEINVMAAEIACTDYFPQGVNVGFVEVINDQHIRLRVYERGAGETAACGSGACAAVVVGCLQGRLQDTVTVSLRGGDLQVTWQGNGQHVFMLGPAMTVYDGVLTY